MSIIKNLKYKNKDVRNFYLLFFTSLSGALSFFEYLIPKPIPWLRIGLANSITLAFIVNGYYKEAIFISIVRPVIVSVFIGSLLSPGFFLSLFGSSISCLFMIIAHRIFSKQLSVSGISLIGAFIHSIIQVLTAFIFGLLININSILLIGGILTVLSTIGGLITAYITIKLLKTL